MSTASEARRAGWRMVKRGYWYNDKERAVISFLGGADLTPDLRGEGGWWAKVARKPIGVGPFRTMAGAMEWAHGFIERHPNPHP